MLPAQRLDHAPKQKRDADLNRSWREASVYEPLDGSALVQIVRCTIHAQRDAHCSFCLSGEPFSLGPISLLESFSGSWKLLL